MDTHQTSNAVLTGRITSTQGRALGGLLVRAFVAEMPTERRLGVEAVTDANGRYTIPYPLTPTARAVPGGPAVFIRVFEGKRLLGASEPTLATPEQTTIDLQIDYTVVSPAEPRRVVSGVVRDHRGQPIPNMAVRAVDRDFRNEQPLGQTVTDYEGAYSIEYFERQFRRPEKGFADLVVHAVDAAGNVLVSSPVQFNAPASTQIDVTIPAESVLPGNLFDAVAQELSPVLDGFKVENIEEDDKHQDLTFLGGETGLDKPLLARYAMSHRLQERALEPEFWFAVLGGSFFQYTAGVTLADQERTVRGQLPTLDEPAVRKALAYAFTRQYISDSFKNRVDEWVKAFLALADDHTLGNGPGMVASALDDAGVERPDKRRVFARLFNEYKAFTPEVADILRKNPSFTAAEVDDLETSFTLADLSRGDASVVRLLKRELDEQKPDRVKTLAKKSREDWVRLVAAAHESGEIALPLQPTPIAADIHVPQAELFGGTLERRFREAFPTTAFAGGLERALNNGGAKGIRHAHTLERFLATNDDFDLLTTPIDEFFGQRSGAAANPVAAAPEFRQELKGVQRVFKLAPTFTAADTMLAEGVHSAQQTYRIGRTEFVRRFADRPGFNPELAGTTWSRAANTHAAVLTVVGDLKAFENESLPMALKTAEEALETFPNWDNLFKAGDICECEHCRSVLSPAAYFADLLMFLRDRPAANPARTVKDILFDRRPDLGYLELNCDNALVTIPYIDPVCEVLEHVVAGDENDEELVGFTAMPAGNAAAMAAVQTALGAKLGESFTLSQVVPTDPDRWVAHGTAASYLLKKKAPSLNFFAEILRNTKASAEELRAYPQYVNQKAYDKLRGAKYPMQLPFDLFGEEVRAACLKANLKRWDLMRTLRSGVAPANPTPADVAAEYFGVSADATLPFDERRIIFTADPTVAGQQALWGESGGTWLADVGNVKRFLAKTGLEYNDLLQLLDLKFVNPNGDITIHHLDATCDLEQKVIQVLDAPKLDRIHRFLRLWRKLAGWKMWELDLVIRDPAIGIKTVDEAFLVALFYFSRLKTRLGSKATVEHVLGLFGSLNIATRFTKLHERREDALYQKLFTNKRLINPVDPAFVIDTATNDVPAGQTLTGHYPVLLAALGLRETDLDTYVTLPKPSDGLPHVPDTLTLSNISFVWRHSWLAKQLSYKAADWVTLLTILNQDLHAFASPAAAWAFVERVDHLKASGFGFDDVNWLLRADTTAKAALKEADATRFLSALRKELQRIRDEFDPAQYDFLAVVPPVDVEALTSLVTSLLQQLNRDEAATQFFVATLRDEIVQEVPGGILPAGFVFPVALGINIRYDDPILRFTGVMTPAERTTLLTDPSLIAITGNAAYQQAIAQFFDLPRLALKFFDPVFEAPLDDLPAAVDFASLPDQVLSRRVSYDAEERLLRVTGILSNADKASLDALSADAAYRNAVNSVFTQPTAIVAPDPRVWLVDADLQFPLRDLVVPANDNLANNLATAATRALAYLGTARAEQAVVEQSSAALGLTEAVARRLLSDYAVLPATPMTHLTGVFAATGGVIDYATLPSSFDAWYWAHRCALMLKKCKLTLEDWERVTNLTAAAQLLDFLTLPLTIAGPVASVDRLLRTSRLLRIRDLLPETDIEFLQVLDNLNTGVYATSLDFATDVERTAEPWTAADVDALIGSLDLVYPGDYLLAETWERLRAAFGFLGGLNAAAGTATTFAAVTMTPAHAQRIKELLRARFGVETWLTVSAEIQDVLRERKRDALAAYILTQPKPADAPSGKWQNTNDLYAYYLLDVEMSSCQLTSRLVQGSGSIQLFVQRCFMGLEPAVEVIAEGDDGDSAWLWWEWMRKYRVWEANRKVFLWPENWIEPELKLDRSSFFKDLENDLLQNEINDETVEIAYTNYLEKLRGVAQLEIAGFYQEDKAGDTVVHVFGRTPGAEPHLYYYRTFDYRQWSPWEKVDLDIQSDYLIPAVVGGRLFLMWPIFTEVPDEEQNSTVTVPKVDLNSTSSFDVDKVYKRLRLQMAVSDYRNGRWTAKRVSSDYLESGAYNLEIVRRAYQFYPVDRTNIDGRFAVCCEGSSINQPPGSSTITPVAGLSGAFEVAGCKGVPELVDISGYFVHAIRPEYLSVGNDTRFMKWAELDRLPPRGDAPENDFSLQNAFRNNSDRQWLTPVLTQTPWLFKMTPPWHLSYFDRLLGDGMTLFAAVLHDRIPTFVGTWLPYFYNDKKRTFFVLPTFGFPTRRDTREAALSPTTGRVYYPEIKEAFRKWDDFFEGGVRTWLDTVDFTALTTAQQHGLDVGLWTIFREEAPPPHPNGTPEPYTAAQIALVKDLITRYMMRFFHYFIGAWAALMFQFRQFHFFNHYHPFVCDFAKLVYDPLKGIPALMSRTTQLKDSGFDFERTYQPTPWVVDPAVDDFYPREIVDFAPDGAYAPYNWELFYHAPLLIANSLSRNQRFEEARAWYHYIFNPIGVASLVPGGSVMSKYWITKPFFETTDPQYLQQRIDSILRILAGDTTAPGYSAAMKTAIEDQVYDWRTYPFEPHRIANYRTVAYQKTVVMKYLDNLIAWGDNLFRQDSMESVNEATQLYILAAEILGPRPKKVPPREIPPVESFNELEFQFDDFSNALIEVENVVPPMPGDVPGGSDPAPLPMLYFCIPHNEKLLAYWDTIEDRLYKLRHCMNIEGVVRQLALFEPPIDPAALVKAVAGGMDISSALADLNAPLPFYRFTLLLQRANEVCNDVKALGGALLAALEKKDAEALAQLRQDHEIRVLNAVKTVREKQIDEVMETVNGLKKQKELVTMRRDYYRNIEKISSGENLQQKKLEEALVAQQISQVINIAASVAHIVPSFDLGISGFGGSPKAGVMFGGPNVGSGLQASAGAFTFWANVENYNANKASINAGHDRRWDDWKHQEKLADKELEQIDRSIAASEVRKSIAEKELDNHVLQIENANATDAFMRSKYTNKDLYQWQIGQISGTYFKSYRLAYDLAKRAERCFRFELGLQDSSFINFGYWDSLHKGLQSGEALQYDLRRLEMAHLEQNRREFELTKQVSLALIDPLALVMLRETGRCVIRLREELFDLDFPGHYFRRIKSVSVTIPCVAGPYTTISATLRLTKNSVRINTANGDNGYPRNTDDDGMPADDTRFVENNVPVKAIAVTTAMNDDGMFELNFKDERYLPFEGAGSISDWVLELFSDLPANNPDPINPDFGKPLRQFDYSTITDAILQVRYTSREDAGLFKNGAVAHLRAHLEEDGTSPSVRMLDLRREFPGQWHRFLHPTNPANGNVFELEMSRALFRVLDEGKTVKINSITVLARCSDAGTYTVKLSPPLAAPPPGADTMVLARLNQYGGLHFNKKDVDAFGIELDPVAAPPVWLLKMTRPGGAALQMDPVRPVMEVEEVFVVLAYEWE